MKIRIALLTIFSTFLLSQQFLTLAQVDEEQAVMNTVRKLFTAMETNDSTLAASLFTKEAQLFTVIQNGQGVSRLRSSPVSRLTSAFASEKTETWHEPIWNERIQLADNLASVWVDYAFYIGSTFSHCGVDAFHLIKIGNKWKIFHLADTRKKIDCNIPDEIINEFER